MNRSFPFLLFVLALACPLASFGLELPLSQIAPRVRQNHPTLKAARLAIDEAIGRHIGAGRLSNPSVGVEFQGESSLSPRTATFSFDQAFPLTRRLHLEKRLTAELIRAAELEIDNAARKLIAEGQTAAVKLLALEQQRALRRQQRALAEELSGFTQGRAAAGELSSLDAVQARLDAQRLLLEDRKLETEGVRLIGELKPMLGLRPAEALSLSGDLSSLTMPAPALAVWRRSDYQLAQTKIAAAQTGVDLAVAHRWQDVTAGIFAAHETQDGDRSGYVGFRVSIPLPLWNRNRGEIIEKSAGAERARLEAGALVATITSEADTARKEMQANLSLARETRETLLPLVNEQTAQLEKAYKSGQTDLITVLRAREQKVQLEAAMLDAARDFHLARIRYEAAIGLHDAPARPSSSK